MAFDISSWLNKEYNAKRKEELSLALERDQMRRTSGLPESGGILKTRGGLSQNLPNFKPDRGLLGDLMGVRGMESTEANRLMAGQSESYSSGVKGQVKRGLLGGTMDMKTAQTNLLDTDVGNPAMTGLVNRTDPLRVQQADKLKRDAKDPVGTESNFVLVGKDNADNQIPITFNNKTRKYMLSGTDKAIPDNMFQSHNLVRVPSVQTDEMSKLGGRTRSQVGDIMKTLDGDDLALGSIDEVIKGLTANPGAVGLRGAIGENLAGLAGQFGDPGRMMAENLQSGDEHKVRTGIRMLTGQLIPRVTGDTSGRYSDRDMERVDAVNRGLNLMTNVDQALEALNVVREAIENGKKKSMESLNRTRGAHKKNSKESYSHLWGGQ